MPEPPRLSEVEESAKRAGILLVQPLVGKGEVPTAEKILEAVMTFQSDQAIGSFAGRRGSWVFRGHQNAKWPLTAKSRRGVISPLRPVERRLAEQFYPVGHVQGKALQDSLEAALKAESPETWALASETPRSMRQRVSAALHSLRCASEFQAVYDFAQICDDAGLALPDRVADLKSGVVALADGEREWVPTETTALAQHHDIHTKLLDWTRRVRVAAYFATIPFTSENGQPREDRDGYFAIWALNADALRSRRSPDPRERAIIRVLECNHYHHNFLHAQDGLFTWIDEDFQGHHFSEKWCYPSLLEGLLAEGFREPVVAKFVFPRLAAAAMRARLESDRISCATVMPTYSNAARSLSYAWFDWVMHRKGR